MPTLATMMPSRRWGTHFVWCLGLLGLGPDAVEEEVAVALDVGFGFGGDV